MTIGPALLLLAALLALRAASAWAYRHRGRHPGLETIRQYLANEDPSSPEARP